MNSSLPGEMKDWPEAQLKDGCFSNTCDYVRRLIRRDQEREDAITALQQTVDECLAGGQARPFDLSDFKDRMHARHHRS